MGNNDRKNNDCRYYADLARSYAQRGMPCLALEFAKMAGSKKLVEDLETKIDQMLANGGLK